MSLLSSEYFLYRFSKSKDYPKRLFRNDIIRAVSSRKTFLFRKVLENLLHKRMSEKSVSPLFFTYFTRNRTQENIRSVIYRTLQFLRVIYTITLYFVTI